MLSENVASVPTESVTAIVSPMARERARMMEAKIPESADGMVTLAVVSVVVALRQPLGAEGRVPCFLVG